MKKNKKENAIAWGAARVVLYRNKDLIFDLLDKKYSQKMILDEVLKDCSIQISQQSLSKFIKQYKNEDQVTLSAKVESSNAKAAIVNDEVKEKRRVPIVNRPPKLGFDYNPADYRDDLV